LRVVEYLNIGIEKLKDKKDAQLVKKEQQLNKLSDEEILAELKQKQLPTFGTRQERLDRLKKFHGMIVLLIKRLRMC